MATATADRKATAVGPFGIEANTPRNNDVLIQSIDDCRLRGAIKPTVERFVKDKETGGQTTRSYADKGLVPDLPLPIPGMQLHVNPKDLTYKVYDPLTKDEKMCERIQLAMKEGSGYSVADKVRGMPTRTGTVDDDRMKTLVREMLGLVEAGDARVVVGAKPDREAADNMPGRYLLDACNKSGWNRPRYEDEVEEWQKTLNSLR